jgi:hypothetical protein
MGFFSRDAIRRQKKKKKKKMTSEVGKIGCSAGDIP